MLYAVKYNRFPDEDFGSEAGATVRAHHSESTTILTGATSSSHHVSLIFCHSDLLFVVTKFKLWMLTVQAV